MEAWQPNGFEVHEGKSDQFIKLNAAYESFYDEPELVRGASLFELLCSRRGCGVSDPRDMIFAHLGLAKAQTRNTFLVDYDRTVVQLYEDIARLYIERTGVQVVLFFVEKVQPEERRACLPSWVPDWSSPHEPGRPNVT